MVEGRQGSRVGQPSSAVGALKVVPAEQWVRTGEGAGFGPQVQVCHLGRARHSIMGILLIAF